VPKFLIVRFSSIGDIVLTSPIVRCVSQQVKDATIHYLTKKSFSEVLQHDPRIEKIFTIDRKVSEVGDVLQKENYDFVIDLHHNLRSFQVKKVIGKPSASFPKLNVEKWLKVNLGINMLPKQHIVDRYFETVAPLGVSNDGKGLEFFFPKEAHIPDEEIPAAFREKYIAFVIGAKFGTKRMPVEKIIRLISRSGKNFILLGGKEDIGFGEEIHKAAPQHTYNACGKYNLHQSAFLLKKAEKVISHDTGLMHIAAAFKKEIISLWGSTIPEFGMYPYSSGRGKDGAGHIMQVSGLNCRPCSKIGYDVCPKEHFKCMLDQDEDAIVSLLKPET